MLCQSGTTLSLDAWRDPCSPPRLAPCPLIHRVLPSPAQKPWKCGQLPARKMRQMRVDGACGDTSEPVGSFLHRARSASRSKPLPRALGGSRRFPGKVDESATGSVNFCVDPGGAHGTGHQPARRKRNSPQIAANPLEPTCASVGHPLSSPLHRARSASRSKPLPRAVGGSRRFTGKVDKSATGSVNFFGPVP